MVYTGKDGFIYWMLESSFGTADPDTDTNQPFNPMETITEPQPKYASHPIKYAHDITTSKVFDGIKEPQTQEFESIYVDPFLGLCIFGHKSVDAWGADGDEIAADFDNYDNDSTIAICSREDNDADSAEDIDRLYTYGTVTQRTLTADIDAEPPVVRETITVMMGDWEDKTSTFDADSNFDDGEWADWASAIPVKDTEVYWDGTAMGSGTYELEWQSWTYSLTRERNYKHFGNSDVVGAKWDTNLEPTASIKGLMTGNYFQEELEKAPEDRNKYTLKFELDDDATHPKYDQITNMYVESIDGIDDAPAAGEAKEITVNFACEDGVPSLSYKYDGSSLADPSGRIDAT